MDPFRLKQFTIRHDQCGHRVGTDGILLGAWAQPPAVRRLDSEALAERGGGRILDIGTGSGLIALMLAQRFPQATVEGIDIDPAAVEQATDNVRRSPFAGRVTIRLEDFARRADAPTPAGWASREAGGLAAAGYTLIVSNPPFFAEDTLGGNAARDAARHTNSLPFPTLIGGAARLLAPGGAFCVIIPHASAAQFTGLCAERKLYLWRRLDVRTTPAKPLRRTLLAFTATPAPADIRQLTLNSPEHTQLTQDFYL